MKEERKREGGKEEREREGGKAGRVPNKQLYTHLGTTTKSVMRYSELRTKCSLRTTSTSDRVIRFPLQWYIPLSVRATAVASLTSPSSQWPEGSASAGCRPATFALGLRQSVTPAGRARERRWSRREGGRGWALTLLTPSTMLRRGCLRGNLAPSHVNLVRKFSMGSLLGPTSRFSASLSLTSSPSMSAMYCAILRTTLQCRTYNRAHVPCSCSPLVTTQTVCVVYLLS